MFGTEQLSEVANAWSDVMGMNSITILTAKGICSFYGLGQTSLIQLAFTALYLLLSCIM
jgi:hypothetical protein